MDEEGVYSGGGVLSDIGPQSPRGAMLDAEVYGMVGEPEKKFWTRKPKPKTVNLDNPLYDTQMIIQQTPGCADTVEQSQENADRSNVCIPRVEITPADDSCDVQDKEFDSNPIYENTYMPADEIPHYSDNSSWDSTDDSDGGTIPFTKT